MDDNRDPVIPQTTESMHMLPDPCLLSLWVSGLNKPEAAGPRIRNSANGNVDGEFGVSSGAPGCRSNDKYSDIALPPERPHHVR